MNRKGKMFRTSSFSISCCTACGIHDKEHIRRVNDMRLFLAYMPDGETQEKLKKVQDALRTEGIQGEYYDPGRMHMTLVFIGDYDDTERVMRIVREIPAEETVLQPEGIDIIRDRYVLRYRGNEKLRSYIGRIRSSLKENGIPYADQPFAAHFTLVDTDQRIFAGSFDLSFAEAKVSSASLLQSNKETGGKGYTLIDTYRFGSDTD